MKTDPRPIKLYVAAGPSYDFSVHDFNALDQLRSGLASKETPISHVVMSGKAKIDSDVEIWAERNKIEVTKLTRDQEAGFAVINKDKIDLQMIILVADAVVGLPGATQAKKLARRLSKPLFTFTPKTE